MRVGTAASTIGPAANAGVAHALAAPPCAARRAETAAVDGADRLAALLEIEEAIRGIADESSLAHCIANETLRLVPAAQAIVFREAAAGFKPVAASHVSQIDANAPLVRMIGRVVGESCADANADGPRRVVYMAREGEPSTPFVCGLLLPLPMFGGGCVGVVALARETPFRDDEIVIARRIANAYGHAWSLFRRGNCWKSRLPSLGLLAVGLAITAALLLFVPVRMSALAPAEVAPNDPFIVAAPIDGVVEKIVVLPSQSVRAGDLLVQMNDTVAGARLEIAERDLGVAEARHLRTKQGAFSSSDMRRELAVVQAELALARAERDRARALFDQTKVVALRDGIAVYADPDAWRGKPVATGERILKIADPLSSQVRVELSVGDSIVLGGARRMRLYLDNDPLNAIDAELMRAAYEPEAMADGRVAYLLFARLAASPETSGGLRIGLRGTAQVFGERVALGYYLLRRPISALRQRIGL